MIPGTAIIWRDIRNSVQDCFISLGIIFISTFSLFPWRRKWNPFFVVLVVIGPFCSISLAPVFEQEKRELLHWWDRLLCTTICSWRGSRKSCVCLWCAPDWDLLLVLTELAFSGPGCVGFLPIKVWITTWLIVRIKLCLRTGFLLWYIHLLQILSSLFVISNKVLLSKEVRCLSWRYPAKVICLEILIETKYSTNHVGRNYPYLDSYVFLSEYQITLRISEEYSKLHLD